MPSRTSDRWVTTDNYSSVPSVLSWFTGVTVFLCVTTKLLTKLTLNNRLGSDDGYIIAALVFSIGMIASLSVAADNGLGRYASHMRQDQLIRFQKSLYATDILYMCTLFFSKGSALDILRRFTSLKFHPRLLWSMVALLVCWTLAGIFAKAFECSTPQTWAMLTSKCIDQTAFWTYYDVTNILSEICFVAVPFGLLKSAQLSSDQKRTILAVFGLRLMVIGAAIAEIYYVHRVKHNENDETFTLWPVQVCRLFVQCFSIICACAPFMNPFFTSLDHGMLRIDDERRRSERTLLTSSVRFGHSIRHSLRRSHHASTSTALADRPMTISIVGNEPPSISMNVIHTTRAFEVHSEHSSVQIDGATAQSSLPAWYQ